MPRLALVLILTILATSSISAEENPQPELPSTVEEFIERYNYSENPQPELPLTVEEFIERYNYSIKKIFRQIHIESGGEPKAKSLKGIELYSLKQKFGKRSMFISITTNKRTKRIKAIFYMGSKDKGESNEQSALKVIKEIEAILMAIEDPNMEKLKLYQRKEAIGISKLQNGQTIKSKNKKANAQYELKPFSGNVTLRVTALYIIQSEDNQYMDDLEF